MKISPTPTSRFVNVTKAKKNGGFFSCSRALIHRKENTWLQPVTYLRLPGLVVLHFEQFTEGHDTVAQQKLQFDDPGLYMDC